MATDLKLHASGKKCVFLKYMQMVRGSELLKSKLGGIVM
jgi:hypothetical protein